MRTIRRSVTLRFALASISICLVLCAAWDLTLLPAGVTPAVGAVLDEARDSCASARTPLIVETERAGGSDPRAPPFPV